MTPPRTPRVTVLMPVYNGERYLREAMDSILGQTFTDFEFLIINDGSTDRSVEIVESYDDSRIRLEHNEENLGLVATLNRGLELARGEYVARMDCDDVSLPERLMKQVTFLDANPQVAVLGTWVREIDEEGNVVRDHMRPGEHHQLAWLLAFTVPLAHPSVMMRRDVALSVGGYNPAAIHYCEDYSLWSRMVTVAKLWNLGEVLIRLRKHSDNVTVRYQQNNLDNVIALQRHLLEKRLGFEVSDAVSRALWVGRCDGPDEAVVTARTIYRLYRKFQAADMPAESRGFVRRDASLRALNALGPFMRNPRVWRVLLYALLLDPLALPRLVAGFIHRSWLLAVTMLEVQK